MAGKRQTFNMGDWVADVLTAALGKATLPDLLAVGHVLQALTSEAGDDAFLWLNVERARRQQDAAKQERAAQRGDVAAEGERC